jgi:hypothetical protein
MSREIRRVPCNWNHPKDFKYGKERYIPLMDGCYFKNRLDEYNREKSEWDNGIFPSYASDESKKMTYGEWAGNPPDKKDYMPEWTESELTHIMMYESTSEGTPISPAFKTCEELARWLADNNASAFAGQTATYEQWLATCKNGWAISAVYTPETGLISGVSAS